MVIMIVQCTIIIIQSCKMRMQLTVKHLIRRHSNLSAHLNSLIFLAVIVCQMKPSKLFILVVITLNRHQLRLMYFSPFYLRAKENLFCGAFRPSQLNYMLHGCKRVSFCENLKKKKTHNHPLHTLIRLICDHNLLQVWFGKPKNFSSGLKTPTLPSF